MKREVLVGFSLAAAVSIYAKGIDNEYVEALAQGADAALNVFVHDENGHPVEGAVINYAFWLTNLKQTIAKNGITDKSGHYLAKGKCSADVHLSVSCEGYYSSRLEKSMSSFGGDPKVSDGKWQPYGVELPIELRKIKNPIHLVGYSGRSFIEIPVTNTWIGFDMDKCDLVRPFGKGITDDFRFIFQWDGKIRGQYEGSSLSIRFAGPCAGGYWANLKSGSEFRSVYSADTNQTFVSDFAFDIKKDSEYWDAPIMGKTRSLVFRTRCKIDPDGNLKEAYYGIMNKLRFGWNSNGKGRLEISYSRNPKVNDANLESDYFSKVSKVNHCSNPGSIGVLQP